MTTTEPTAKFLETDSFVSTLETVQPLRSQSGSAFQDFETADEIPPEQALWRAVIAQALMDATTTSRKSEQQYHRNQAINWLTSNGQDFVTVCQQAGVDPVYVRERAKEAIHRAHTAQCSILQEQRRTQPRSTAPTLERKSLSRPLHAGRPPLVAHHRSPTSTRSFAFIR
jgi:hypothetical protein